MKDIVERLRNLAERFSKCTDQETCAEAADELDRLNAEIARLREALKDARNNGLIYWEPRTERGHVSKAQMLSRIDAALAGEEKK